MDFFQTVMGKRFYESTMPRIAQSLERIADALERIEKEAASKEENAAKACRAVTDNATGLCAGAPSLANEIAIFTRNGGWFYMPTSSWHIDGALQQLQEDGMNLDNLQVEYILLRDPLGIDIDERRL